MKLSACNDVLEKISGYANSRNGFFNIMIIKKSMYNCIANFGNFSFAAIRYKTYKTLDNIKLSQKNCKDIIIDCNNIITMPNIHTSQSYNYVQLIVKQEHNIEANIKQLKKLLSAIKLYTGKLKSNYYFKSTIKNQLEHLLNTLPKTIKSLAGTQRYSNYGNFIYKKYAAIAKDLGYPVSAFKNIVAYNKNTLCVIL
jgi:hypothetical protein